MATNTLPLPTIDTHDPELTVLEMLDQGENRTIPESRTTPSLSQRSIAKTLDLSLGMTNAIIKRLVAKGWVTIHKINAKNLRYSLTPEGTREVTKRTYRYLRRTMGQVGRWKEKIQDYMDSLKAQGYTKVQLVGQTDLDFILEHCAIKAGLEWEQGAVVKLHSPNPTGPDLVIVVETATNPGATNPNVLSLDNLLLGVLHSPHGNI